MKNFIVIFLIALSMGVYAACFSDDAILFQPEPVVEPYDLSYKETQLLNNLGLYADVMVYTFEAPIECSQLALNVYEHDAVSGQWIASDAGSGLIIRPEEWNQRIMEGTVALLLREDFHYDVIISVLGTQVKYQVQAPEEFDQFVGYARGWMHQGVPITIDKEIAIAILSGTKSDELRAIDVSMFGQKLDLPINDFVQVITLKFS